MAAAAHPQEPWNKAQFDKDNRIPAAQYELLNSLPGWGYLSTVRARSPEALREPLARGANIGPAEAETRFANPTKHSPDGIHIAGYPSG